MKTEVRTITPLLASEMLKKNLNNRKVSEKHVSFLANEMKNENWLFDGQPLRFDTDNVLIDGQHRLNAIVKSNSSYNFLVITGLQKETFKVMDTGKNRNASDVLSINGEKYYTDIATCARFLIMFKQNNYSNTGNRQGSTSNTEIVSWLENNRKIIENIKTADKLRGAFSGVMARSNIAYLLFLFSEKNVEVAETFMSKLCTGLDLTETSPIFILRKALIKDKMSKSALPPKEKLALIFKAWNAYRINKSVKVLRWNKENESFPVIM